MRKVISIAGAPRPRGAYSQAIVADGFIFVAGQLAINPATEGFEPGDITSETRRALDNIRSILEAAGSSMQEVVRLGVFLADLRDFTGMNEVFQEYFPGDPPARTTIEARLPRGLKIEIDCIARVGG